MSMGALRDFKLDSYGCNVYIETGTGECITLSKAVTHFTRCFSVDIDKSMVEKARNRFPNTIISHGLSTHVLKSWLENKSFLSRKDSVLFFLDAHFPGADYHGAEYDVMAPNAVPMKEELQLIKKYRYNCKDIIICDDARIYTTGPFEAGNFGRLQVPGGYQFVYDLFPKAKISLSYSEEGYIIIDNR